MIMTIQEANKILMHDNTKRKIIEAVKLLADSPGKISTLKNMETKPNCRQCFSIGLQFLRLNNVTEI